jgi:hypothetical protein
MIPALARFVDELRADPRFEPAQCVLRRVYDEGCENADGQTLLDGVAWLAKQKRSLDGLPMRLSLIPPERTLLDPFGCQGQAFWGERI